MDSVSHYGERTVGQASLGDALATFFRQTAKPTVERGATGFRWPFRFGFRSHAHADSPHRHRRAVGEAHGRR
ncbi:hypothetical protein [Halorarum salinum]|uniref:Uncharacterized protein n=1 Tax=Halorarum salinum TaxID=2743089 RepID=A0A7D5QHF1_9EURY|nr:hypothetical protein [Halobaculum salinum]QLG62184.1 hypothetical protein HUG12_10735 [Halobaculum salinum]